ncbi:MAG: DUF2497 domain-containing protein [Hellea sp.]
MSEQTPDTNSNMADGQDPSMEDILASIRKIIADDEGQETGDMVVDDALETEAIIGDVAELVQVDTLDLDVISDETPTIDMDIEALIGDMDVEPSGALEIPQIETPAMSDEVMDDVLDLEIPLDESELGETGAEPLAMDDTLDLAVGETDAAEDASDFDDELDDLIAEMDDEIISRVETPKPSGGLMGGAMAALGLGSAAGVAKPSSPETKPSPSEAVEPLEDDLSLMLDNMLEDSATYQEAEAASSDMGDRVIDPAEDLLAELDFGDDDIEEVKNSGTDPDMDLVKSLMADLTEQPLHDEPVAEAVPAETNDIDDDASADDVMDEILSMTLDDETKLSEELTIPEIPAPENENAAENVAEPAALSLKEIAAQAEADAATADSMLGKGLAAAAGLGAVSIATAAATDQNHEDAAEDSEPDDIDAALSQLDDILADKAADAQDLDIEIPESNTPEPHQEPHIEETPKMARAKTSDAIIDEVTETATAGAFASLTNVVEEKATVAERGDRIGDLVMEALQPMLKEWLDANLKGIVERAVTKEVKRISSGK